MYTFYVMALRIHRVVPGLWIVSLTTALAPGQASVEKNVVSWMYSGWRLLRDVNRPTQSNGYGLIVVPGSGWISDGPSCRRGRFERSNRASP